VLFRSSMIYQDEQAEKQNRMDFLAAIGGFMQQAIPAAQASPELTPLLMEMIKFAVTGFKVGKQLEGLIDETADKFREQAKAAEGQPKPPSPEMQKIQAEQQAKQAEMQMQHQLQLQLKQADVESERAKQEFQSQETQLRLQLEDQRNAREAQMTKEIEQLKIEAQTQKDVLVTYLDNANKIETARISAGLDDGAQAYQDNVVAAQIMQDTMGYSDMRNHPLEPAIANMNQSNQQMTQLLAMLIDKLNNPPPKQVLRDENGKIVGVR